MKAKILLFGMTLFLLTFASCNKDDEGNSSSLTSEETMTNAKMDAAADDVSKIIDDQYNVQENSKMVVPASILPSCATVTTVVTGNTWTRTIDFGTTGCDMPNGNSLRGTIIVSGSTDFNQSTHTIHYSFLHFYHNNTLIEGNNTVVRTLESTNANANLHPVANMTIHMTFTLVNGNVYTRVGNRVREMVVGYDTPDVWLDNEFLITGSWVTTLPNGGTQNSTITTPLRIRMNCNHIVSGVLTVTRNNVTATLDYGDGSCDNIAVVTINGVAHTITLG
ncbi:hypothetical protein [Flavobacterium sp. GT3R68]|uniref:hypothetical protein n=1 Tax=Flavobacterium sp. GT3R68 TaxID=2594437 RepID=UPI000F888C91|nr:hypothetical protein [Flavobacterium sp. GT3R68]RTY90894.1 hypothetical protein EKL32_19730 [Flavobacterium sp. GSN2]TRW90457.1 hypothetical protein FNW07_10510 [Flavobacterium sp. GT3R68]